MKNKKTLKRAQLLSIICTKEGEVVQRELGLIRGDTIKIRKDFDAYKDSERTSKLMAKTQCKFFVSINKKKELIVGRSHDNEIIDTLNFKLLNHKITKDISGPGFELNAKYFILLNNIDDKRKENLFIDLLNMKSSKICLEGINYAWIISKTGDLFVMKYCRVLSDDSIEEVGPCLELQLQNEYHCGEERYQQAIGENKNPKKHKNTFKNGLNDKIGVLHIDKQDLKDVKTRKSRAYKLSKIK